MDFIDPPLALLAGVLTIASPCVLPLMPVVLGTSVERASRVRPLFIVSGFVLSFAALGMLVAVLSQASGHAQQAVRATSIALLALFGLARVWPGPYDRLIARIGGPLHRVAAWGGAGAGHVGGFVLGATLGAVWTPCAGPVLASILILAAKAQDIAHSGFLLLLYAIGAGIPMLAIAYGGRFAVTRVGRLARHAPSLQRGFGVLLILTALAMYFQYDVLAYAWIANLFQ